MTSLMTPSTRRAPRGPWPPGRSRYDTHFEVRTARLRIISTLLGANIADFDGVRDARHLSDGWDATWSG